MKVFKNYLSLLKLKLSFATNKNYVLIVYFHCKMNRGSPGFIFQITHFTLSMSKSAAPAGMQTRPHSEVRPWTNFIFACEAELAWSIFCKSDSRK